MPKIKATITITEIDEIHEAPTAWLIALPDEKIVSMPKSEYIQVAVSNDPEEKAEN